MYGYFPTTFNFDGSSKYDLVNCTRMDTGWLVYRNVNVYHPSTDGLMGHKSSVVEAFNTLAEAIQFIDYENGDTDRIGYDDDPDVWLDIRLVRTYDFPDGEVTMDERVFNYMERFPFAPSTTGDLPEYPF